MVIPTWLFGSCSVLTESDEGIAADSFYGPRSVRQCLGRSRARRPERWAGAGVGRHVVVDGVRRRARRVVAREPRDVLGVAHEPAVVGAGDDVRGGRVPVF